jgi:hypothetical protein
LTHEGELTYNDQQEKTSGNLPEVSKSESNGETGETEAKAAKD